MFDWFQYAVFVIGAVLLGVYIIHLEKTDKRK